jgi:hypothetical protein
LLGNYEKLSVTQTPSDLSLKTSSEFNPPYHFLENPADIVSDVLEFMHSVRTDGVRIHGSPLGSGRILTIL